MTSLYHFGWGKDALKITQVNFWALEAWSGWPATPFIMSLTKTWSLITVLVGVAHLVGSARKCFSAGLSIMQIQWGLEIPVFKVSARSWEMSLHANW